MTFLLWFPQTLQKPWTEATGSKIFLYLIVSHVIKSPVIFSPKILSKNLPQNNHLIHPWNNIPQLSQVGKNRFFWDKIFNSLLCCKKSKHTSWTALWSNSNSCLVRVGLNAPSDLLTLKGDGDDVPVDGGWPSGVVGDYPWDYGWPSWEWLLTIVGIVGNHHSYARWFGHGWWPSWWWWWVTIPEMVGDHLWDGRWPSFRWWLNVLLMMGDHTWDGGWLSWCAGLPSVWPSMTVVTWPWFCELSLI